MDCSQLLFASLLTILHLARIANAEYGLYLAINPLAFTEGGTADGEVVKFEQIKPENMLCFLMSLKIVTCFFCLMRW